MALNPAPPSLAVDARSLSTLSLQAGKDQRGAIKEAAKQFEALFMRELIKSMREATMKSGLLDNEEGDLGTQLLDEQLAVSLSGLRGGLSEVIAKQLERQTVNPPPAPAISAAPTGRHSVAQQGFVARHTAAAAAVERSSGIPAGFMIGQAGHETGWGRSEIRRADGQPSFNLFGIKAGAGWQGKVASVTTTEYINGQPRKLVAKFRAYDSYEESFRDYARLITQSPRYAGVSQQTTVSAFASGLQRAGYATDPAYASKLSRAINTTLQLQRAQA